MNEPRLVLRDSYPKHSLPDGQQVMVAGFIPAAITVRRFSTWKPTNFKWGAVTGQHPGFYKTRKENYKANKELPADHGIKELANKFGGQRLILVGSGRSLVKNGHNEILRKHKRESDIVMTINGAVSIIDHDLIDFHFIMDATAKIEWFVGMKPDAIKLVAALSAPPDCVARFDEKYFYNCMRIVDPDLADELEPIYGELDQSMVSSYSALHLAWQMGFREVALVGHDFAWTDGWYQAYERWPYDKYQLLGGTVEPDIRNNPTMTDEKLMRNAHTINAVAFFCEQDGMKITNCSEDGVLSMLRRMPLGKWLQGEIDRTAEELLREDRIEREKREVLNV